MRKRWFSLMSRHNPSLFNIHALTRTFCSCLCACACVCVCVRERERESECGCVSLSVFMCLSHSVLCVCVSHRRDCFSRLCQGKSEDVSQTKKVEFLSFSQKEENLVKNLYSSKTRQNGNILFGRF